MSTDTTCTICLDNNATLRCGTDNCAAQYHEPCLKAYAAHIGAQYVPCLYCTKRNYDSYDTGPWHDATLATTDLTTVFHNVFNRPTVVTTWNFMMTILLIIGLIFMVFAIIPSTKPEFDVTYIELSEWQQEVTCQ